MPQDDESLSARGVTQPQAVILLQSMMVDWRVMEHLHHHGVVENAFALREADGCCKPDGGTCCVNAK